MSLDSSFLNIGGTPDDPFYRYKMPKVSVTHQRKSGGTTVVDNTSAVCASLNRDAKQISGYLSKELGRLVGLKGGYWSMHGIVEAHVIQTCILNYVNAYVLCGKCGNPETVVVNPYKLSCKSCGHNTTL